MSPDYQRVYEALRERLAAREWPIGGQIPSISALQQQYEVHSLNSVRRGQQMLVAEGLLRTEQGRGAFVAAYPPRKAERQTTAEAAALLEEAMRLLTRAQRMLEQRTVGLAGRG